MTWKYKGHELSIGTRRQLIDEHPGMVIKRMGHNLLIATRKVSIECIMRMKWECIRCYLSIDSKNLSIYEEQKAKIRLFAK